MAVAKEQIRQIISENNINSVADIYTLLKDSFKDIPQELMEAELDATPGYEKNQRVDIVVIGFIFMAIVCGLLMQVKKDKKIVNIVFCVVGMLIGTAIAYAFGTMWFCYSTGTGLGAAMALCVIPFIPGDLIKIAIAAVVAPTVANQIKRI